MNPLDEIYKNELRLLKHSAKVFSDEHPALTESLVRESNDPDVEMVLQGVAYLTAQFKREIDSQFPVALQSLSQVLTPTLMQPIPAVTILSLKPKPNLINPLMVEKGRYFDTKVLENEEGEKNKCRFSNAWDIDVLPIEIVDVEVKRIEEVQGNELKRLVELKVSFDNTKNDLENFSFDKLRFFINLNKSDAAEWLLLLTKHLQTLEIKDAKNSISLDSSCVRQIGFEPEFSLYSNDSASTLHQLLQEFFLVPDKFLYLEIDLRSWKNRKGERFEFCFKVEQPKWRIGNLTKQDIALFSSPSVNLFNQYAEPVNIDPFRQEYPLVASESANQVSSDLSIVDVISVESVMRNREKNRKYQDLVRPQSLEQQQAGFQFYRKFGDHENSTSAFLALQFPPGERPTDVEVLRAKISCCHGAAASNVNPGDVSVGTSSSPELVSFTNLTVATEYREGTVAGDNAWQVISDQSLNLSAIENERQLKNVLSHHIPIQSKMTAKQKINLHQIESIEKLEVEAIDYFKKGILRRGNEYRISMNGDHFNNVGELYLFGCLLNQLFALHTAINSFSQLIITDIRSGEVIQWPVKMGAAIH